MSLLPVRAGGKIYSQLAFNAVSVLARLFAGVILFIFMAKEMGPSSFGQFMYAMSLAALLAFPAALGFGQQVLRESAAYPMRAEKIIAAVSAAKGTMTVVMICFVALLAFTLAGEWLLVAILTAVALADSATEYLFCVLRARGLYAAEAGFMSLASVLHFVLIMMGLGANSEPLVIGVFFLISKALQTFAAWLLFKKLVPNLKLTSNLANQWLEIKAGFSYAGDVAVSSLSSQIDTIIVRHTLGLHAAGLYQSGMRLIVGLQNFSVIAGNVFIPRLAAVHSNRHDFKRVAHQAGWVFGFLGVGLAAVLCVGGAILVEHGYGEAYESLRSLLPLMALLLALRLFAAGLGVQLTALGDQRFRTFVNLICLVLMVLGLWVGGVNLGLAGVLLSLVLVIVVVMIAYYWRLRIIR